MHAVHDAQYVPYISVNIEAVYMMRLQSQIRQVFFFVTAVRIMSQKYFLGLFTPKN